MESGDKGKVTPAISQKKSAKRTQKKLSDSRQSKHKSSQIEIKSEGLGTSVSLSNIVLAASALPAL
jgi:hypothetical protein